MTITGAEVLWLVMGAALVAYVLTGGADFGGGFWDLVAFGPRKKAQREAIEHAIAPIWEANHVWLIFIIVVMFTAFPRAFAVIGTILHIPIAIALVGIVLRGASFTFRAYGLDPEGAQETWGRVFAWSSALTPIFLGLVLAAVSTGEIRFEDGEIKAGYLSGWLTPFSWLVGVFALVLFALLAAVYLTSETEGEVQEDFRKRAIGAEIVAGFIAALVFLRSADDAPLLFRNLAEFAATIPVQGGTALAASATIALLYFRRFRLARLTVAIQVALVIVGWGVAMDTYLVMPDISIDDAGVQPDVVNVLIPALAVGAVLLVPSLWYLFRVFKARR